MEKYRRSIRQLMGNRGATALMVAVMMLVFLGIAALAVDIGFTLVTRNQLQNVSDAASLAAARKLGSIYAGMTYEQQQAYVCNPADIIPVAQTVAFENAAAGKNITVDSADVTIGQWKKDAVTGRWDINSTLNQPDAVRVIARRDSTAMSLEGPITTFFAKIFGMNTLDVRGGATAALTGEGTSGEGGLFIPAGIPRKWFEEPAFCTKYIKFSPTCPHEPCTGLGCAGWTGFTYGHSSSIVRDILRGNLQSPEVTAYVTQFDFTGGDLGGNFDYMKQLFDTMKVKNDGVMDSDEDSCTWTTRVVVYDWNDCSNPNGEILIVGFSTVTIYMVTLPSGGCDPTDPCCARFKDYPCVKPFTEGGEDKGKSICAQMKCDNVEPGRGGGGEYGTKGDIPNLVE